MCNLVTDFCLIRNIPYDLMFFLFVSTSKRIIGQAAVPLVPGYHGHDQDIDLMRSKADKIDYPVLIKLTHGGGGKNVKGVFDTAIKVVLQAPRGKKCQGRGSS